MAGIKVKYIPNVGIVESNEGSGMELSTQLNFNQSVHFAPKTYQSNQTLDKQNIILVDAISGSIAITLPDTNHHYGKWFCIKKIDSSTNAVNVNPQSGQLIDGEASKSITTQYNSLFILASGSNWYII